MILILHNIRSIHNVGSIFRTADGFGIEKLYTTGYSPYPMHPNDIRLPHIRQKITQQIHKTALGAERTVDFAYNPDPKEVITNLKQQNFTIVALEQSQNSILLQNYEPPQKLALLLGEEVYGITDELLSLCDDILEIPMQGQKESFNVSIAAGIAMYALTI